MSYSQKMTFKLNMAAVRHLEFYGFNNGFLKIPCRLWLRQ